ncbi:hypothetical protein CIW48_26215 [Methylobacterium sp. P1-11]|uniref:hypothetical protein n=1 Tax=Methylobacterium sp. P1-11 TaxID=2024616 RepID=UPI0011EF6F43|nr:hypothetical protein [Methylobacterium sp. P1-11]KAA0121004.1 hypothetical protein CIW48_26215 [Methylobacterium sp. P1-11]
MAVKQVEAQLVLGGKDGGAAAAVNALVKAFEQAEKAGAGVSKSSAQVARTLLEVEKAQRAVDTVMSAQRGVVSAEANLAKLRTGATTAATALDKARTSHQAFEGLKATKGSELASQMNAAAKAVAAAEKAQKSATREVMQAERALEQQTRALREHERAATAANVPLKALEQHQAHLARAYDQTSDALRRQIRLEGEAGRAAQRHAHEQAEAARHIRQHGAIGLAAGAAAGAVSAHSVVHHTADALRAGSRLQHETVALQNAGRTPHELEEIAKASERTVRAVPTATFEENLKVVNETVSAFGSLEHALEHLTFMQKASAAVHAAAGGKITDSAGEMGNKLARFAEERGSAGDGHRFERETEGLIRAMVFSGGNFNPHEAINFAQQAKSSLRGYDEEFLTTIMPSIVGTMKGERAGTAANAFNNVINGKVNDKKQAEEWMRYGLLDKSQVIMKAGHATAWRSGAVKGTTLAHQNPLKWMETVVLPALKAKGVNVDDDEELSKVFATMFRQNTSNFFANEIGLKSFRARLHKDADLQKQVGSLDEIYHRNLTQDPTEGVKAFKAGIEDLMAAATNPLMLPAAAGLKTLAEGLQSLALMAKDHPYLAAGAGGAAVAGGLAASGYASYKLATGFGLPAAAAELTVAAKALEAAAAKQMTGGGLPEVAKKGGGALPLLAGGAILGGTAAIGYLLSEYGDPSKSVNGTGGRPDDKLTLNPSDELPGLSGSSDASSWAPKAQETGKAIGTEIGKAIADAPLPPRRPAMLEDFKQKADESGTAAGKTILQRLMEAVSIGLEIPIRFTPGEGGGGGSLVQKTSLNTGGEGLGGYSGGSGYAGTPVGGGGGGIVRASPGIGGGVGRVGSVRGISARDMRDVHPEMAAYIRAAALANGIDPNVALRIANSEGLRGSVPGVRNTPGDKGTSFGPFQLHYASRIPGLRNGGLGDRYTRETGHHASDPKYWKEQIDFALRTARREGWGAWHGRYGAGIGLRDGIGTVRPVPMSEQASRPGGDGEPRLVKGLDGKEGLDLGDGTMKMPDGSIRSITSGAGARSIPDAPKAGAGAAGMGEHVEALGRHIDRLADAQMRVHASFEVNAGPGLTAKAKRLRSHSDGPLRGNVGVSMPGAEGGVNV